MSQQVSAAFIKFDANKSGHLGVSELHAALGHLGLDVQSSAETRQIMNKYDTDGDRKMSLDEFAKLVKELKAFFASQPAAAPPAPAVDSDVRCVASLFQRRLYGLCLKHSSESTLYWQRVHWRLDMFPDHCGG